MLTNEELSKLTLVASDMAYAASKPSFFAIDKALRPYPDTPNYETPSRFDIQQGFTELSFKDDKSSGFKYILFKNAQTDELIVAFGGTDGLDPQDWAANSLHLGWNQWDLNRAAVFADIAIADTSGSAKIHFTGQSLGGALAEYAAYDFLTFTGNERPTPSDLSRVTVTTFNGLGGEEMLQRTYGTAAIPYSDDVLGLVSESAAYHVRNDLVSRLGGGHAGIPVYVLDHVSGKLRPGTTGTYYDMDPIDSHRIETGFYAKLSPAYTFYNVRLDRAFDKQMFKMSDSQRMMGLWGGVFGDKTVTPDEAKYRIAAALVAGTTLGSPSEINEFAHAVLDAYCNAGDDRAKVFHDQLADVNWGKVLRWLSTGPTGLGAYASLIGLAYGAKPENDNLVTDSFQRILNVAGVRPIRRATDADTYEQGRLLLKGIDPTTPKAIKLFGVLNPDLQDFTTHLTDASPDWLYDTANFMSEQAKSKIASQGLDLSSQARALIDYDGNLASFLDDERAQAIAVDPALAAELDSAKLKFIKFDLAQALVNLSDVLQPTQLAHANVFGNTKLDFQSYDRYRDALADAAKDPQYSSISSLLSEALETIDAGGQMVVVRPGLAANPFDAPNFAGENEVAANDLREGGVSPFSLYLPYNAGIDGQRVTLKLSGPNVDKFQALQDADPVQIGPDGTFELTVAAGTRQIEFGLRADQDIDTDETLSLSAQLTDAAGNPTHQTHTEVSVNFDAIVEAAPSVTGTIVGTALDDNRLSTGGRHSVLGTAGNDRAQGLAGRDEVSGNNGDDIVEGGTGIDVVAGNDGNDAVFADVELTEVPLRDYINTSATAITTGAMPTQLQVTSSEWLQGGLGDDTVVGADSNDILFGSGGRDLLVGGAGHDVIDGDDDYDPGNITTVYVKSGIGPGAPFDAYYSSTNVHNYAGTVGAADEIHAGSGDDWVFGMQGVDSIFGDDGNDTISGGQDGDAIFGGAGNDRVTGDTYDQLVGGETTIPAGDDYIDGGAGDDTLFGDGGADTLLGGAGSDQLRGNNDLIGTGGFSTSSANDSGDYLSGGDGSDQLIGDAGDDTLMGGDGSDSLFGDSDQTQALYQGNDYMDGGAGNDYLRGYGGDDTVLGGWGDDQLLGEAGDDFMDGGSENDILSGGDGNDKVMGSSGNDSLLGGDGNDVMDGGIDDDYLGGDAGDDQMQGDSGQDMLYGGIGNDTIDGGLGDDTLYGEDDDDTLDGGAGSDTVLGGAGADTITGGGDEDQLWGDAGDDHVSGGSGSDVIHGGDGNDLLEGEANDDVIYGEAGDDTLDGGSGRNFLLGGSGNDTYLISGDATEDVIIDTEGANIVKFTGDVTPDQLQFRGGSDQYGNNNYLVIEGFGGGRVVISGGLTGANAMLQFSNGAQMTAADVATAMVAQPPVPAKQINLEAPMYRLGGTVGNDSLTSMFIDQTLDGFAGNDTLTGYLGNDTLNGGVGNDRLDGGAGNDTLTGGDGQDTYVFGRGQGSDTIIENRVTRTASPEADTLELGAGITPTNVRLLRDNYNLVVMLDNGTTQARVQGYFLTTERVFNQATGQFEDWPADNKIEQVRFANGTLWDTTQIAAHIEQGTPNAMTGTAADNTFTVDSRQDTVTELAGGGNDTINSSVSYILPANVERLNLTGSLNAYLWANTGNAVSYLTGNPGNNTFNGPGAGIAQGGYAGYSVMTGGPGDDTYYLSGSQQGQVNEAAGEGTDTVVLTGEWINYTLPANVERLVEEEGGTTFSGATRYRTGNALDNWIEGFKLDGNIGSVIDGSAGADTMVGYGSRDVYIVDNAGDKVIDNGGLYSGTQLSQDEIRSSVSYALPDNVEALTLTGSTAIDGWGNELDNRLDGTQNAAANKLYGGTGDDYYAIGANDTAVEQPGAGVDTIEFHGTGQRTYTPADLLANFEGLALGDDLGASDLQGTADDDRLTGNASANHIVGDFGDDALNGGAGNDTIDGGAGDDVMRGGDGIDTYTFSRGFGNDWIVDYPDTNAIVFDATISADDVYFSHGVLKLRDAPDQITLANYVGYIRFADGTLISSNDLWAELHASDSLQPSANADMLLGTEDADTFDALGGDDWIYGYVGDDTLQGGTGNDHAWGGAGNDTIGGGAGVDLLWGGAGNDALDGGDGTDTIDGDAGDDRIDGGNDQDWLYGDAGNDTLIGGSSIGPVGDALFGGDGNDILVGDTDTSGATGDADGLNGEAGDDVLRGNAGYDALDGGTGNDLLDGGLGQDMLRGGQGNDTYVLRTGDGNDTVIDPLASGEISIVQVDAALHPADVSLSRRDHDGYGWLLVSANAGATTLELQGYIDAQHPVELRFADGTVWDANYVLDTLYAIRGTAGADTLNGTSGDDRLAGLGGNDILHGNAGNDHLDGGTGADQMFGDAGNDTYIVDDVGDVVTELAGAGFDTIQTTLNYTLPANVEELDLTGNVAVNGTGNSDANVLRGNAANNVLDGGTGSDATYGGQGDDTFIVDDFYDYVSEAAGEGSDTVRSSLSWTLAANVENLRLIGTATLVGTGNTLDNMLTGGAGDDALHGLDGNDTLDGGIGADLLVGGLGNDTFIVDNPGEFIIENAGEGIDAELSSISFATSSNVENLTLIGTGNIDANGNGLANVLTGNAGDNVLDGKAGIDTLIGGLGNDTYGIDHPGDVIVENAGEGTDTILSAIDYTLGANLENLTLNGFVNSNATGNALNNTITGDWTNNVLDGGAGADTLIGGYGNDTCLLDNASDVVVENAGEGADTVKVGFSYVLAANVDNLVLTGPNAANGTGNSLWNTLTGNAAANVLDGGLGGDTMQGGAGNDTYVVDDYSDAVVENAGEGTDLVQSAVSFTLGTNVENLTLTGLSNVNATGNTLDNSLTGNAGSNRIDGGAGADTMAGGAGSDDYYVDQVGDVVVENINEGTDSVLSSVSYTLGANVEYLTLTGAAAVNGTGNALANILSGNAAANVLDGGAGNDTLIGGAGDDLYIIDSTADVVTEAASAGIDSVQSSVTCTLSTNAENLTLTGGAAINGTGNSAANVLTGNSAANTLNGGTGADTLAGGAGDDIYVIDNAGDAVTEVAGAGSDTVQSTITYTLGANLENLTLTGIASVNATGNAGVNAITGNTGANVLDGGAGADMMVGGTGNDTYIVDNVGDVVTEAASAGTDLVQSGISLTLGANVENLTLTGVAAINATGNASNNSLTGNAAANVLDGGAGTDTLAGGAGDDLYIVDSTTDVITEAASAGIDSVQSSATYALSANIENLVLTGTSAINATGNTLNNALTGNTAANVLSGGAGSDTMIGGLGNDTYVVDVAGDIVTENAGEGTDTVQAAITYALGANVENLTLTGAIAINGTGNALVNTLTGNTANNILDGGAGADTLKGGAGNDTYVVDNAGDVITENASEGTDLAQSSVTFTLAANVENLTLTGTAAINATGNTLNNTLTGNAASNVLSGGAGTDTMIGGLGNDTYVVDVATDIVTELANEGTDTVQSAITYTLGSNVENLTLTGAVAVNGTGNALVNTVTGNTADNVLDGGAGADALIGGAGNDTYVVDNAGDAVTEAASAGIDAINASVTYVLAANVEYLTLTSPATINGTGNALDNWLHGNAAVNTLDGGSGNDTLWGADGDDVLLGNVGNDLLQGGLGNDTLTDTAGNNLLDGGAGTDTLTGGAAREMLIGGSGSDTLTTGGGADVIGFNKGDGADTVNASAGTDDTLTLGGGLAYSGLKLKKTGLDLILDASNGDQITFKNWYQTGVNNKSVLNLQVVVDAMAAFNPSGSDPLLNKKVVDFNFSGIAGAFDAALAADPTITSWNLTNALASNYLSGSDTAAIGGDFGYDFGHRNALTGIGAVPGQSVLAGAAFATSAQTLQAAGTLYAGTVRLN